MGNCCIRKERKNHWDEQLITAFVTSGQGEVQNNYQYNAFGVRLEAAEQYYLRARYYNPVIGRFM